MNEQSDAIKSTYILGKATKENTYKWCMGSKITVREGLKTRVLERGRNVEHIKNYTKLSNFILIESL